MIVKSFVSLDPAKKADREISKKILAIGVRVVSRRFGVSPAMVSLFAAGQTAMCGETAEKIIKYAKRVKAKNGR